MAKKQMSDYKHNVRMSMRNLGYDVFANTYFRETSATIGQVRDGYKELRNSSSGSNMGFNDIKSKIKTFPAYKFMTDMTKRAFDAVRTGKFYDSEDEIFGMGAFDDFDFDFGSNFDDNFFGDNIEVQEGQDVPEERSEAQSSSNEKMYDMAKIMSKMQSKAASGTVSGINKLTVEALFATSQSINNALATVSGELKAQLITNNSGLDVLNKSTQTLTSKISESVGIQTNMLSELKMLREMTGDYYIPKINELDEERRRKTDNDAPQWYQSMKDDKYVDALRELSGSVFRAVDNQASMGILQQISMAVPLIMMTSGGNPFSLLKTWVLEPFLDKKFGMADFASRVDQAIKSVPDMIDSAARTASLSDNGIIRSIGESVRSHRGMTENVTTDKYNKAQRVFFDGMTREAIVNVIPTYLSSIVALLSNNERYTYDYERGMFRSISEIKNNFIEAMPKLRYNYSQVESIIKKNLAKEDIEGMDDERMKKFAQIILERMTESNYTIKNFKNLSYEKALEVLKLRENELSESDFVKIRAALDRAEKNEDTYMQLNSIENTMTRYFSNRNKFMRDSAYNARENGSIAAFNGSYNMVNGAQVLGGFGGGKKGKKPQIREAENHLLHNYGKVDLGDSSKLGNILGTTYSEADINIINDKVKELTGGAKIFMPSLHNQASLLLQSRLANKLGLQDADFYEEFKNKSMYDTELILANVALAEKIAYGRIAEDKIGDALKDAGVSDDGIERIIDALTDPEKTQDDVQKAVEAELDSVSQLKDMQEKINSSMNDLKEKAKDKYGDKYEETKEKVQDTFTEYSDKAKNLFEGAKEDVSEMLGTGTDKAKSFYEENKGTIGNVLKATLGLGAGYTFLKTLSHTGVGQVVGAFGLMSPIALAAGALGAGIYAYRTNLFDRLFGDSDKTSETMKKVTNVVKTGLMGAGGIAGLSFLLSPITGGTFGLMGPAALAISGLAMGIVGELKGVKKAFFGTEEGSFAHNMKVWIFGDKSIGQKGLLTGFGDKLKDWFSNSTKSAKRWFEVDIWKPLTETFKPINTFINTSANKLFEAITGIPATLESSLFKNIRTNLTKPLMDKFNEGILQPVGNFVKKMTGGLGKFLGGLLSAPFKFFRTLITGKTDDDYFATYHGSSSSEAKGNILYAENMKAKKALYEESKLKTLDEAKKEYSKKDFKQIRKMRAKEKMVTRDNLQNEVIETKDLHTRLAEYKASKEQEHGQGIPREFFSTQNTILRLPEGVDFNFPKYGCGLSCLSMVASTLTGSKIEPNELISEKFGWDNERYARGIDPVYMINVLAELGIHSTLVAHASVEDVERHLKNGGLIILDMDDLQADTPHYVVIDGVLNKDYFTYSDPARGTELSASKELLMAKTKRALFVYKRKRTFSERLVDLSAAYEGKKAEIITSTYDWYRNKVDDTKEYIDTYKTKLKDLQSNVKFKYDQVSDTIDLYLSGEPLKIKIDSLKEAVKSKLHRDKNDTVEEEEVQYGEPVEDDQDIETDIPPQEKRKERKSFKDYVAGKVYHLNEKRKNKLDKLSEKYTMRELIKTNQEILTELRSLREDNYNLLSNIEDTIYSQTNSVPYNVEYIKRVLVKAHGQVDGFSENDIGKNSKLARIGRWFTRKGRALYNLLVKPFRYISNKMGVVFDRINKAIDFVTTFPQRLAKRLFGIVKAFLPSKETIMGFLNFSKKAMINMWKATKEVTATAWRAGKAISSAVYGSMKSFTKSVVSTLGKSVNWLAKQTHKFMKLGFDMLQRSAGWLWDRGVLLSKLAYGKVKDGMSWIFGKTKDKIKDVIAPREVFVLGGQLDGVKTIEVVKAIGAVDLDYAESIHRKLPDKSSETLRKAIESGKPVGNKVDTTSPKFKSGQEYALIEKRQDSETQNIIMGNPVGNQTPEPKKEEGFFSKIMNSGLGNVLGTIGGSLAGTILTGVVGALSSVGLYKLMDGPVGDAYSKAVDSMGYDGEWNREHVQGTVTRPGVKMVAKATSAIISTETMQKVLAPMIAKSTAIKDAIKSKTKDALKRITQSIDIPAAIKTITTKLKAIFTHPKIMSILGDGVCGKIVKAVPKIAKKAGEWGSKAVAKGSIRMASYGLPPVGVMVDIAFMAYDLLSGMTFDADNLVGVSQSDLSATHRIIAGVVKMIQGFLASKGPLILLALIPTDWLVQTLIECISDEDEYSKWLANNKKYLDAEAKREQEEAQSQPESSGEVQTGQIPQTPTPTFKPVVSTAPSFAVPKASPSITNMNAVMSQTYGKPLSDVVANKLSGYGEVETLEKVIKSDDAAKTLFNDNNLANDSRYKEVYGDTTTQAIQVQETKRVASSVNEENFGGNSGLIKAMSSGNFISSLFNMVKGAFFGEDKQAENSSDPNAPVKIDKSQLKKLSDPEYRSKLHEMYNYARQNYGEEKAKNLMRIAYAESGWIQNAQNPNTMAEGLFQVIPSYRKAWGFNPNEAPATFAPVEQLKRVAPNLLRNATRDGAEATLTNMYAALHYPVAVGKSPSWVLYGRSKDPKAYQFNQGVDYDKDGNVTYSELGQFVANNGRKADAYAKELGLQGYGDMSMISQNSAKYNKLSMGTLMTFKDAGCGPAVMAMLLDKLGIKYNMEELIAKAKAMRSSELSGTPITYFKQILSEVGITSAVYTDSIPERFVAELRKGNSPILLTEAKTGSPHYIIGKELGNKRIIINDPLKNNSEAVTISDRRIRNAKAILVYFVPNKQSSLISEALMAGGYGLLDDLQRTVERAPKDLIGKLENQAYSHLSRNSKFNFVDKLAKDIVRQNTRSLNGMVDQYTRPISDGIKTVNGIQRDVTRTIDGIQRQGRHLADLPGRALKELSSRSIAGVSREINRATQDVSNIIRGVTDIGKHVSKAKQTISNATNGGINNSGSTVSSAVINKMANDLSEIKELMRTLVGAVTKGVQLTHNDKKVNTTVGGRPVPAMLGESSSKAWYDTIDAITRGK